MAKPLGLPNNSSLGAVFPLNYEDEDAITILSSLENELDELSNAYAVPFDIGSYGFGSPFACSFRTQSPDLSAICSPTMDGAKSGLVARPKTAGEAPSVKKSKEWLEDRMAMGSPIEVTADQDVFRFPTPVRRPVTSSNSSYLSPVKVSQDSGIGMAIGSPSQQVHFFSPTTEFKVTATAQEMAKAAPPARANTTRDLKSDDMNSPRPKISRWRSLGGIFGRKRAQTIPENYSPSLTSQTLSQETLQSSQKSVMERSRSITPAQNIEGVVTTISAGTSQPEQPTEAVAPLSLFRRVTKRGVRVRNVPKPAPIRTAPSPPPKDELPPTPQLIVDIPNVELERYSVMFKELKVRPTRSSSLLARRQAGTGGRVPPNQLPTTLELEPPPSMGRLVRRATEPSPRTAESPSLRIFPVEASPQTKLPHISSLSTLHRPRPVKRNQSAPPALPSPSLHSSKLSPTFEADEMDIDDRIGLTPTPSSPASPSTPRSIPSAPLPDGAIKAPIAPVRTDSWDAGSDRLSQHLKEPSWEMITVAKRLSPGDLLNRAEAAAPVTTTIVDDAEEWVEEKPQVAIARSLSVTKAGTRQKLHVRPTRVSSRRVAPGSVKVVDTTGDKPLQSQNAMPANRPPLPRTASRREELQRDLTREIWGERDIAAVQQVQHNQARVANLCVVEEPENRKSVWGVIESA